MGSKNRDGGDDHTHVASVVGLAFGGVSGTPRDRLGGAWTVTPDSSRSRCGHVVDSFHVESGFIV